MRHLLLLAGLLLGLGAAAQGALAPAKPEDPWRVVLIRGWDSLYRSNVQRESALRDAIEEHAPRVIEFFPEETDPLRFPDAAEPDLVMLLKRKYRETPIDLVVAMGVEPLEFATRYREQVWPGAAIVFAGLFEGSLDGWRLPPRTTGVLNSLDVERTLELGRAIAPQARALYLVSGSAEFDMSYRELVMKKLAKLSTSLEIRPIVGLSRAETAARVASLDRGDLVLYLTMLRDSTGQISGPSTPSLRQISFHSRAPVLVLAHTQLGQGPVGGFATRHDEHGRAAGKLSRRVLEGLDPDTVPVAVFPAPECVVDWSTLGRYGIPERSIPADCSLINEPVQLWRIYFWPLLGLLAVIVLQSALIASLVAQSRRRARAEAELQARFAEQAQVARLSMVGALTASIAHEINQPMGAILGNAEAAEMMLEQGTLEPDKLREILADIRQEDLRASDIIRSLRKLLGRHESKLVALDINAEVAEALKHVSFEAARRGARLTPLFATDLPSVLGDAVQLQQVVINLVMNAMQAASCAPHGSREIRIETRTANQGVEVSVSDLGPGVPPEDLDRLFQSTFTTRRDGMGFGLSIVRSIVENHRGRVWHHPNVPRGAIFSLWLPALGT